ncbi:MAG: glycoside hydrolase family 125 protein [Odoribacteraceae bacterium]|jgi:meiotically up-regulated gene 157 (Mug157) protein|nr:glycoside hydrolase family 125 protein [Odoribacteraceae bacterium]
MTTRRDFLKKGGLLLAATAVNATPLKHALANTGKFESKRPPLADRKFTSRAVEELIATTKSKLKDPKLAWMFENCFPNTLDTTVDFRVENGRPDTFVITGDINAMWLRDSAAQVWPYIPLCTRDEPLRLLLAGVINRQTRCILLDPYANSFTREDKPSEWASDITRMKPYIHERKWEIDSLCYPARLAYHYWKTTGDTSIFDAEWKEAARLVLQTFREQQRKEGHGPYSFMRKTERQLDTVCNDGHGHPVNPVGMIVSTFRPSDDATTFGFLVPSNLFAIVSLRQIAEISRNVTRDAHLANHCEKLADEVQAAVEQHAIVNHPTRGKVYAYEVDGFGNAYLTDDANIPSLLSLPYLGAVDPADPVYRNTRELVWSTGNPYFFRGKAAEGIGGPHIGHDMIWPMSIIARAMTSNSDEEITRAIRVLRDTDADTGFMHESFHKDNPARFTRRWFAWANTLFGELIVKHAALLAR